VDKLVSIHRGDYGRCLAKNLDDDWRNAKRHEIDSQRNLTELPRFPIHINLTKTSFTRLWKVPSQKVMSYNNQMFPGAGGNPNMYNTNPNMMNQQQQQQQPYNPNMMGSMPMGTQNNMAMMPAGSYQTTPGAMAPYSQPGTMGNTTQQFVQVQQVRRQVQTTTGINQSQQFMVCLSTVASNVQ
jgi:hypothetical protein